jgi:hypothetical protein
MPTKDIYCYRILKTYSLIVNFDDEVSRSNVPSPTENETFKQWKDRVLGSSVTNVTVFTPSEPASQTRISTLQNKSGAEHLERVFRTFGKEKDAKNSVAMEHAVKMKEQQLSTLPKSVLEDILSGSEYELEPSVVEFLQRFEESTEDSINAESIIRDLIKTYNNTVRLSRKKE